MDHLIVMDNVLGVADISKKNSNFLTVSIKFGYHCLYFFHVIAPARQISQKIISQTNMFNIFPSSVPQQTVAKILQSNCISQSKKYVPIRSLWLSKVLLIWQIANKSTVSPQNIVMKIKMDLDDIDPQLTILTNRFAILISHMTMNFTTFS